MLDFIVSLLDALGPPTAASALPQLWTRIATISVPGDAAIIIILILQVAVLAYCSCGTILVAPSASAAAPTDASTAAAPATPHAPPMPDSPPATPSEPAAVSRCDAGAAQAVKPTTALCAPHPHTTHVARMYSSAASMMGQASIHRPGITNFKLKSIAAAIPSTTARQQAAARVVEAVVPDRREYLAAALPAPTTRSSVTTTQTLADVLRSLAVNTVDRYDNSNLEVQDRQFSSADTAMKQRTLETRDDVRLREPVSVIDYMGTQCDDSLHARDIHVRDAYGDRVTRTRRFSVCSARLNTLSVELAPPCYSEDDADCDTSSDRSSGDGGSDSGSYYSDPDVIDVQFVYGASQRTVEVGTGGRAYVRVCHIRHAAWKVLGRARVGGRHSSELTLSWNGVVLPPSRRIPWEDAEQAVFLISRNEQELVDMSEHDVRCYKRPAGI